MALGDRSLQAEAERAAKNFLRRFIKQFRNLTRKVLHHRRSGIADTRFEGLDAKQQSRRAAFGMALTSAKASHFRSMKRGCTAT